MSLNPISHSVDTIIHKRDLYQQVTDTIITQLEKGVVPWACPPAKRQKPLGICAGCSKVNLARSYSHMIAGS